MFLDLTVSFALILFLKNFNFSKISLSGLAGIREGSLTTSACLSFDSLTLLIGLLMLLLEVNLANIFYLNALLFSSVMREYHPALYMEEINCQIA